MAAAGVPAAAQLPIARAPCVVKADGLAAGKGVYVCRSQADVESALARGRQARSRRRRRRAARGPEVSLFALCDGGEAVPLVPPRTSSARTTPTGPNTGGMGSYAPVPGLGEAEVGELVDTIHRPVLEELARRGCLRRSPLRRAHADGGRASRPRVQLPLRRPGDAIGAPAARWRPRSRSPRPQSASWRASHSRTSPAPRSSSSSLRPDTRSGDRAHRSPASSGPRRPGALVFHAGTALHGDRLVTNGGRILGVTGRETVGSARDAAYAAVSEIDFVGARYRNDIAAAAAGGRSSAERGRARSVTARRGHPRSSHCRA